MADAGNGVSGSDSSRNASDAAQRSAETAAAQQAAADKAAADAVAAAAVDPVQAAPVDLSISPATISQLSAIPVDTVPNLASFPTLGGVPTAATYADIAQKPAVPASIETNVWSPSFSITPNEPAAVAAASLSDVSINLGLNHVGDFNASIEARMDIAPASVTGFASVSFNNSFDSLSLSTTLGPFGPNSTPNYSATLAGKTTLGNLADFDFSASATFNNQGFDNAAASGKLTRSIAEGWSGSVQLGVSADRQGVNRLNGEGALDMNQNGLNVGFVGRGSVDLRTGDTSGYFGVHAKGQF
ncbi:hypothetical protein [Lysobacter enzymogenes]|uniref:hypothetical protein n=1 Tax=Lysobacter enzymogenes TaxID=69 RepID=UPI000896C174|nr:hypothetical protein [Lysobacter enzymogenes]SDW64155.1 hypothetical protein SAMN05421681_102433 [Lysobacter enzymogenes]